MKKLKTIQTGIKKSAINAICTLVVCLCAYFSNAQLPTLLKNINPTSTAYNGPSISKPVTLNGKTIFIANDGVHGYELWTTDGTALGTQMLLDINPAAGVSGVHFEEFYEESLSEPVNGKVFFSASSSGLDFELWVTDGTALGTKRVKNTGLNLSQYDGPRTFRVLGDKVYYFLNDQLWVSNGKASGTKMIEAKAIGDLHFLSVYNNKLLYYAYDSIDNSEPWDLYITDGTIGGGSLLIDANQHVAQYNPRSAELNGLLYFVHNDGIHGYEIWVTDGTPGGTHILKDIISNSAATDGTGNEIISLTAFDGKLYFAADTNALEGGVNYQPWVSDGTEAGTVLLKDIECIGDFKVFNNQLFFGGRNNGGLTNYELWVSDGTETGTTLFKDVTIYKDFPPIASGNFHVLGDKMYFSATAASSPLNLELFETDGTPGNTIVVNPAVVQNPNSILAFGVGVSAGKLYITANYDETIGYEAYVITGNPILKWTGNVSTNWFDKRNWNNNEVPAKEDDIKIPAGCPRYPSIVSGQDVSCKQLILETGASFTMLIGSNAFIYGKITAPDAGVFNLLGGTMNLFHGSIFPPDMSFNHLTIKNINNVEDDNYFEIPGNVTIFGNFTVLSITPSSPLPFINLKENDVISLRENLTIKDGKVGWDFQYVRPTDRSKIPTIRMDGTTLQTINIPEGLFGNLYINNSNTKLTGDAIVDNLILNTNFDLAGKILLIGGKIIYTDGLNNSIKITNSKPTKGLIFIENCISVAYDSLPQYIKITKLQTLRYNLNTCNSPIYKLILGMSLITEKLEMTGFLDLGGKSLTIGATTHDRGRLLADSIVSEVATGTLKLLGNSNTPQYILKAKKLNNLEVNSPAGVIFKNVDELPDGSDGKQILKLFGKARLISGDADLDGVFIDLRKDNPLSPVNIGKIIETPGNVFYNSNTPCQFPDCGLIALDTVLSNAISNVNLGGLGFIITCPNSLNTFGIDRSNGPFQNLNGFTSINRMYRIRNPQLSTSLDAQIKIKYDESELNGVNESDLKLFRISFENAVNGPELWTELASSVNTTTNTVTSTTVLNQLDISPACTFYTLGAYAPPLQGPVQSSKIPGSVSTQIQVYPNPFKNTITTQLVSETVESATLKINDISGKLVHTQTVQLTEGINTINVDVNDHLPSGIYIQSIISLHQNKVVKIVKE